MRKHGFLLTITAAILAAVMCGCRNEGGIDLPASSEKPEEQASSTAPFLTVVPDSEYVENKSVGINPDVVWGIGKTFDEVSEKYGGIEKGNFNTYQFKNGYGIYVWKNGGEVNYENSNVEEHIEATKKRGGCDIIDGIKASDFLVGEYTTLNYEEFAEKCGVEFTKFTDPDMDNCYYGYFKHPSYDVYFAVYTTEKDKIDENAHFMIGVKESIW